MADLNILKGSIHIHSHHSDGTGSPMEIIKAAQKAGLDYIIFSDHFNIDTKKYEGKFDNLFVISAYEWDEKEKNHSLVFNSEKVFKPEISLDEMLDKAKFLDGKIFMAHPDEQRNKLEEYPPYQWTNWDINEERTTGIEIWNFMSEWMENLTRFNKLINLLFPMRAIKGPTEKTLSFWDKVNQKRRFPAIGGSDAHAIETRPFFFKMKVFPYEFSFKTIRTNLVFKEDLHRRNFEYAKEKILNALCNGQSYIANTFVHPEEDFQLVLKTPYGEFLPGAEVMSSNDMFFYLTTPQEAEVVLLKNGKIVFVSKNRENHKLILKGRANYRLEVKYKGKNWIYTNNFYIR